MTAPETMAALCALGVEIDPVNAALVMPPGGLDAAGKAALADLRPLVALHRAAILAEVVPPWLCETCDRTYFVPVVDVREFLGSPHFCQWAVCPQKRGT